VTLLLKAYIIYYTDYYIYIYRLDSYVVQCPRSLYRVLLAPLPYPYIPNITLYIASLPNLIYSQLLSVLSIL
jgi:hypothetical protein